MICQALMTSTCQVRSYESIDRFIELLGLWKLNYLASDFGEKKETKMKMKLNEWRRLAGCYFFPTFSLHVLLNILNLFVTNQQIINIVLEYKYFVSCWQHNFVSYCLSCDWSCTQNLIGCLIVWLPHRPSLFGVRYCVTIGIAGVKRIRQSTISVSFDWALFAAKNTGISVFIGIFLAVNRYPVKFNTDSVYFVCEFMLSSKDSINTWMWIMLSTEDLLSTQNYHLHRLLDWVFDISVVLMSYCKNNRLVHIVVFVRI